MLSNKLEGFIVQKYHEKPSLVNGRKYDLRYFMLVACAKPLIVLTNTGYARVSLEKYKTKTFDTKDKLEKTTIFL